MFLEKPIMGWNSWNTFAKNIHEELIMETVDALVEKGYKDAGYEYVIIDDCWSKYERENGLLVPDEKLFPHGMRYLADYIHSKGLKFGMYSCAGIRTCADYPSSFGYEYSDAAQFAEWGVDYLKYDFCNFPDSADCKNAYLTMSMALRNCGRDIVFAACNWGMLEPCEWMRSHGVQTYRSTGDIFDNKKSFTDIFRSQISKFEYNAPGCFNDMDMLTVGMHGKGNVGLGGCTSEEYLNQFAIWAFCSSPLIIGADVRTLDGTDRDTLLNKNLISLSRDPDYCPPFRYPGHDGKNPCKPWSPEADTVQLVKLLSGGRFAVLFYNDKDEDRAWICMFDDIGIHVENGTRVRLTDGITGEDLGIYDRHYRMVAQKNTVKIIVGELVK